jgi:hypothetical protein
MNRILIGVGLVGLVAMSSAADAASPVDRPQLIAAMEDNCFSSHANAEASEKAKCKCFARAFVDSLTPGEIAVPRQSAAINAKLAAARHACHFGDF